jgi:hypothetical protein
MNGSWATRTLLIANALQNYGFKVLKQEGFKCVGMEDCPMRDGDLKRADVVIYNHTKISDIRGNVLPSDKTWIYKASPPTQDYATLDDWGYGAYMSCSYVRPPFEDIAEEEVLKFWDQTVSQVKDTTKWGAKAFTDEVVIEQKDYILFPTQCVDDEVVKTMYFGNYRESLINMIREAVRVGERDIVVKLHPYTDYRAEMKGIKETPITDELEIVLKNISNKVHVYRGKSHIGKFIDLSHTVMVCNSAAGVDALLRDKPVISWGYPEYHWATFDLRHLCDMQRALRLDWYSQKKARQYMCWFLRDFCYYNQASANRRVGQLLGAI